MTRASQKKAYIVVLVVGFILIVGHYTGILKPLEEMIRRGLMPSLTRMNKFSIQVNEQYEFFKDKDDFISAYRVCRENGTTQDELEAKIKILTAENNQLRQQIGFFSKANYEHVVAEVVGKDTTGSSLNIIINKGSNQKIEEDQPVIVGNGTLVGRVIRVNNESSVVQLLSDNHSKVAVTILNHDSSLGVVEGGYGISLKVNLIPRDETVLVADQVITSGLEANIPRGLLIGTVAVVENEPYKPFQQAILTPGADLSKLDLVSVLLIPKEKQP